MCYEIIRMMNDQKQFSRPTEKELEILRIVWEKGPVSVKDVHELLGGDPSNGFTTILKLMQIMNEKGLVKRDDSIKTHIYQPAVTKEKTQKHMLGKMINTLFGGSTTELVIQALGNHKATADELEEIQKLLTEMKNQ